MQPTIELSQGLSLAFGETTPGARRYATSRLQRGLLLLDRGEPLAEEAVGFGVPIVKRGLQTIFPGSAALDIRHVDSRRVINAKFKLDRVEQLARGTDEVLRSPALYAVKDLLSAVIRAVPISRGPLMTVSAWLRRALGLDSAFTAAGYETTVNVKYTIEPSTGRILVELDCSSVQGGVTEVILMHEQGAHFFDRYQDSSGLHRRGDRIGLWDEVRASEAWFESSSRRVVFRLGRTAGTRLFRGRELVGSRLAWAGFGYSFPPALRQMQHEITISRLA